MEVAKIQAHTSKIDEKFQIMDHEAAEYVKWEHGGQLFTGMRKKGTFDQRLGVVRQLSRNGAVFECCYKENRLHGFSMKIYNDAVQFFLHSNGKMEARVCFDKDLEEKYRWDPNELLTEISTRTIQKPMHYKKEKAYDAMN